jgi:hypothetical protein
MRNLGDYQISAYLPKIYTPHQKSRYQNGDKKQVPYRQPAHFQRHVAKLSCPCEVTHGSFTPWILYADKLVFFLIYRVFLLLLGQWNIGAYSEVSIRLEQTQRINRNLWDLEDVCTEHICLFVIIALFIDHVSRIASPFSSYNNWNPNEF